MSQIFILDEKVTYLFNKRGKSQEDILRKPPPDSPKLRRYTRNGVSLEPIVNEVDILPLLLPYM